MKVKATKIDSRGRLDKEAKVKKLIQYGYFPHLELLNLGTRTSMKSICLMTGKMFFNLRNGRILII